MLIKQWTILILLSQTTISSSQYEENLFARIFSKIYKEQSFKLKINNNNIKNIDIQIKSDSLSISNKQKKSLKKGLETLAINSLEKKITPEELAHLVRAYCTKQGYLQIDVRSELSDNHLKMTITPKEIFSLQNHNLIFIDLQNDKLRSEIKEYFKKIKHKKLNLNWFEDKKAEIISLLKKNGYWNSEVKVVFNKKDSFDQLTLQATIIVNAGQQVKFGKMHLVSPVVIPEKIRKTIVPFKEGHPWNSDLLQTLRKNAEQLNIFENVKISYHVPFEEKSLQKEQIPISIFLYPKSGREVKLSIGAYSSSGKKTHKEDKYIKFRNKLYFQQRNILCNYDFLKCNCGIDTNKKFYQATYIFGQLHPYLPYEIIGNIYAEHCNIGIDEPEYFCINTGIKKQMSANMGITLNTGFFSRRNYIKETKEQYLFCSTTSKLQTIQGGWMQEQGFSLLNSNTATVSFNPEHKTNFISTLSAQLFYPCNKNLSIVTSATLVKQKSDCNSPTRTDLEKIVEIINNKRILTETQKCSIPSLREETHANICLEIRKRISSFLGVSVFFEITMSENLPPIYLLGTSILGNTPLGGLCLNFGWVNNSNSIFWKFKLGEYLF